MFGIGIWELIVIGVVCIVAVNPKDVPTLLRKTGKWYRELKDLSRSFTDAVADAYHEQEEPAESPKKTKGRKK